MSSVSHAIFRVRTSKINVTINRIGRLSGIENLHLLVCLIRFSNTEVGKVFLCELYFALQNSI